MAVQIAKLGIAEYRQFRDVLFDFTDPCSGRPLQKVCFIGGNGTGKSTLLKLLWRAFEPAAKIQKLDFSADQGATSVVSFYSDGVEWGELVFPSMGAGALNGIGGALTPELWSERRELRNPLRPRKTNELTAAKPDEIRSSLCAFCPPDSEQNADAKDFRDVPATRLNDALVRLKAPLRHQVIGQSAVKSFWLDLIAAIKAREAGLLEYQKLEANRDRTIREVEMEYLRLNPDVLQELSDFWNSILAKAGLEFDLESASIPIQLSENLKAYIRLQNAKSRIQYADLSTGIRNFIFKLGHILTIFRGKPNNNGVLLVDEPENSLYPDFLFDLVDHYRRAAPGAQLFMATHSPIIAAQFRPEERFILEFDETGGVSVRQGVTPEGDDPNDVLLRDFAVRTLYGAKGLEKWRRFRELDRLIQSEKDSAQRRLLLKEYMDLGKAYNFSPDEISG